MQSFKSDFKTIQIAAVDPHAPPSYNNVEYESKIQESKEIQQMPPKKPQKGRLQKFLAWIFCSSGSNKS
ncbi:Oidioi.mRNA.OKI2018_I69.XSR.g14721.t1.cds [Oikopleura dioica]|uniref:Oidioi.mRNA.OKI2018_I69.XSR.g14721.t1.cds n=1 Tax=Oikopleura dioica TaxID=34765 RepID=A0ABN7SHY5_OIKDI|nr:Oidioi.mRNA.OKI2018_I69.XSR.g14721.t1.cds [Oikopleura dioica]